MTNISDFYTLLLSSIAICYFSLIQAHFDTLESWSSSYVFLEVKYLMLCVVKVFFLNFVPRMHSISLTK